MNFDLFCNPKEEGKVVPLSDSSSCPSKEQIQGTSAEEGEEEKEIKEDHQLCLSSTNLQSEDFISDHIQISSSSQSIDRKQLPETLIVSDPLCQFDNTRKRKRSFDLGAVEETEEDDQQPKPKLHRP